MIRVRSGMGAFLLALLALPHFARAQQELRFTPVGRQESLLQSSINCMAQDSAGYLWIGTEEGLVRFDGKNFSSWYHQDGDSTSLCQNRVEVIRDYPGIGLLIGTQQTRMRSRHPAHPGSAHPHWHHQWRIGDGCETEPAEGME